MQAVGQQSYEPHVTGAVDEEEQDTGGVDRNSPRGKEGIGIKNTTELSSVELWAAVRSGPRCVQGRDGASIGFYELQFIKKIKEVPPLESHVKDVRNKTNTKQTKTHETDKNMTIMRQKWDKNRIVHT